MKKRLLLVAVVSLLVSAVLFTSCKSSSKATSGVPFKFNLEKGKGYDYEMEWDLVSKVAGAESRVNLNGLYSMVVTGVEGDVRTVTTSYKRIHMKMNVMGMELDVDSDKPQGNEDTDAVKNPLGMMNRMVSSLVNKPFTIKVNEEGKILEVAGFDKIIEDMFTAMNLNEEQKAQAMASMKDQFSEQSVKDQFSQVFYIFPNKDVKVGDTWEKSFSTGGKMGANNTTTFTVKSIEGDHVYLGTVTKISADQADKDINGTQTGNILVDGKSGLMISADFDQDIKVKTQDQNVTVTGKGKIKGTQH